MNLLKIIFASDETSQANASPMRRQLHWLLFMRVVVLSILLGVSVLMHDKGAGRYIPPLEYIAYFIAGVYFFTIISALFMRRLKNITNFAFAQILADNIFASCLILLTGASQSLFVIVYLFPIITGAYMLFRVGGLLMAAVSSLSYGAILGIEFIYGPRIFIDFQTPLVDFIVVLHYFSIHGLIFFLVAFLTIILAERLRTVESALSQSTLNFDRLSIIYKQIFDDITTGIITVNTSGNITSFNRASSDITGYQPQEVIGKNFSSQFPGFTKQKTKQARPLANITRKDGRKIPVGYSWSILNLPGEGGEARVYTMQNLSQIKKMEEQIKQSEKMAAIGEMAAGIAHEFRNPLAAISGASQVLAQDFSEDESRKALTNIVLRETDRMEGTIDEFLQFSKPTTPTKQWFSLSALLSETLDLLKQAPKWAACHCQVKLDVHADLDCWADDRQIKQVLLNLINNSCAATSKPGSVITISAKEGKDTQNQDITIIKIKDTGCGIDDKILAKIFEPFFTTRENGTGLGLAIVKQIVSNHDGKIRVDTVINQGTTFTITLPLPANPA